jgi:3'(2'), 5'-bisphosphate nucleotidase
MKDRFVSTGAEAAASLDIAKLIPAVIEAGACIMLHRGRGVAAEAKRDSSPVTAADRDAEAILLKALARFAPAIPVVAEEESAAGRVPDVAAAFFLVDPLDGTKEFISGGDDFTVNVALVVRGETVAGIVHAPARSALWWGDARRGLAMRGEIEHGAIARSHPIAVRACAGRPKAVASKSHSNPATEAYLHACASAERVSIGSSLKFVLLAEGAADLYPRPGPTMEWDTAAGHAVLLAAGGKVFDLDGRPLTYGKERYFNPGFVASGPFVPPVMRPYLAGA